MPPARRHAREDRLPPAGPPHPDPPYPDPPATPRRQHLNPEHLRALLAIVDTGTFEAAARSLHLTPSAVSQRIKALESSLGRLVVRRTVPCRATEAGRVLVRMARQFEVLQADAAAQVDPASAGRVDLPVVVNADSLATWFVPVLATVAGWGDTTLRLHVEDQGYSADLLRAGDVVAAVTSDPVATQGCEIRPLGAMRYLPMATPALRDRYRSGGSLDWARMPVVRFNAKDELQHEFLARRGVGGDGPPVHVVPSSQGFLAAVAAGLGWGMVPALQVPDAGGSLVRLAGDGHVDVPLHWQAWRLRSPRIERVGEAVAAAARAGLR